MFRLSIAAALAGLAATAANAQTFQGTFSLDDQVELFSFTSDGSTPITLESYGYAGGTAGTTAIPAGGFAPSFILFDPVLGQIGSDQGGHCGITAADPVTGNCDDPYISQVFGAGAYDLALVVWDNSALGNSPADGFKQDGNPGFTCSENGVTGDFCDVTDALLRSRTGDWALTITGATNVANVTTPEPSTLPLALAGVAVVILFRARRERPARL